MYIIPISSAFHFGPTKVISESWHLSEPFPDQPLPPPQLSLVCQSPYEASGVLKFWGSVLICDHVEYSDNK